MQKQNNKDTSKKRKPKLRIKKLCRKRNPHAMQANDIYEGQSKDREASFDSLLKQLLAGCRIRSIKNRI